MEQDLDFSYETVDDTKALRDEDGQIRNVEIEVVERDPLLAFDEDGGRLGQGGGYYDRWIAANPDALRIGLAWDAQKVDRVPMEEHDRKLHMVVTPQRVYEMAA